MKTLLLIKQLLLFFFFASLASFSQTINFPDAVFQQALLNESFKFTPYASFRLLYSF